MPADASPSNNNVSDRAPLPDVATDWCLDGWRALDEGTCYLVPEDFSRGEAEREVSPVGRAKRAQEWEKARPKRLLIYLSGIVPPVPRSPQKENVQRIVAAAARRAHAVALLPRGRRGIGPTDAKDWWAWPTSPGDYASFASGLVASFLASRATLEGALGRFDRTYLAGSSSGAYFLSALALTGAIEMDGYAAASGGAPGLGGSRDRGKPAPFYVGYGDGDPTNGGPKALGAFLTNAGWPVRVAAHPGGHGAREVYLDEAFAFWAQSERDGGP